MKPSRTAHTSGFFPPGAPWGWPPFGAGDPPNGFPFHPTSPFHVSQTPSPSPPPGAAQTPPPPAPPPADLWQQIGGLDGIIANMGKLEKILKMSKSFTPYMKMFIRRTAPLPPPAYARKTRRRSAGKRRRKSGVRR